ncbi:MAG: hypothetical protein JWO25_971 [Alphaproteobacteria bacterium]|nr:hypothetical protein [Alphaproteobacteria bacterium]
MSRSIMDDASASQPGWMQIAEAEEKAGISEFSPATHSRILEYLATCEDLEDDEFGRYDTPWCSAFVNWCVLRAGLAGTNSGWARSWRDWGSEDLEPGAGSIAVWSRFRDVGAGFERVGGHVAFLVADHGETVEVLGGNQRDQVCRAVYPKNGFLTDSVDRSGPTSDRYEFLGFRKA